MEKFSDQIIDYLNDNLDNSSKDHFENEMAFNHSLASEVELYKDLYEVHEVIEDQEITSPIHEATTILEEDGFFEKVAVEIESDIKNSPDYNKAISLTKQAIRPIWSRNILSLAASILLLISVGFGWANLNYSNHQLANNKITNSVIQQTTRTADGQFSPLVEGIAALQNKDFQKAITFFEVIPSSETAYLEARLFLSIAQFQIRNYRAAQSNARLVMNGSERNRAKSKWILVNALLANNEIDKEFTQLLEELAADATTPFYQKSAIALQKELQSFWRKLVI